MNNWDNKFTIRGLFRTKAVLDRADYIVINMCDDEWYVVKSRDGLYNRQIIGTDQHNQYLMECNQPIVLDHEYIARDEQGRFIY